MKDAWIALADALWALDRNEEAIAAAEVLLREFGGAWEGYLIRAEALHDLGRHEEAVESILNVVEQTSDPGPLFLGRAVFLRARGGT